MDLVIILTRKRFKDPLLVLKVKGQRKFMDMTKTISNTPTFSLATMSLLNTVPFDTVYNSSFVDQGRLVERLKDQPLHAEQPIELTKQPSASTSLGAKRKGRPPLSEVVKHQSLSDKIAEKLQEQNVKRAKTFKFFLTYFYWHCLRNSPK